MGSWATVIAALTAGFIGVVGGAVVRLMLDRRQEQVRARAYARIIEDELEIDRNQLEYVLETRRLWPETDRMSTQAWAANRAAIASQVLAEEFLALSSTYRFIGAANAMVEHYQLLATPSLLQRVLGQPVNHTSADDELTTELKRTLMVIDQLGLPSIRWLASAKPTWFKRRRAHHVRSVYLEQPCHCGHPFDHHRIADQARHFRLRHGKYHMEMRGHECNVVGCGCSYFQRQNATAASRLLIRLRVADQAVFIPSESVEAPPSVNRSYPMSAQAGARVEWDADAYLARVSLADRPTPD